MSDDGRRIEVLKKVSEVVFVEPPHAPNDPTPDHPDKTLLTTHEIYYGIMGIMIPDVGPKEIKFEISGVENLDEAFAKHRDVATNIAKEIKKQWQSRRDQLVTAGPDALHALDRMREAQENQKGPGKLIL